MAGEPDGVIKVHGGHAHGALFRRAGFNPRPL